MKQIYVCATLFVAGMISLGAQGAPKNLVTNPTFANNGEGWTNVTTNGAVTVYYEDGSVLVPAGTSGNGDNIVCQPITLDPNEEYTFFVKYKTNNFSGQNSFCGFWQWSGSDASWVSGAYLDNYKADDWTQLSVESDSNSQCIVLAANGASSGAEVYYKDVWVVMNPWVTLESAGAPLGETTLTGEAVTVNCTVEGYDLFYTIDGGTPVAISGNTFTPEVQGVYKVYAEFMDEIMASVSVRAISPTGYDALAAEARQLLDDPEYANVTGEERSSLEALLAKTDISDATSAAVELTAAMNIFKAAKSSYDAFAEKVSLCNDFLERCTDASAEKREAMAAQLVSPSSAADALARVESIVPYYRAVVESHAVAEGRANRVDMTEMIECSEISENNPSIYNWEVDGVDEYATIGSVRVNEGEGATLSDGEMRPYYFDTNNWDDSDWGGICWQEISLGEGVYRVSVIARGSSDLDSYYFFAGDKSIELEHTSSDGGIFGNGWNQYWMDIVLTSAEDLEIGVGYGALAKYNWCSFDKFQLVHIGEVSGVSEIEAAQGAAEYYNLQGLKVSSERMEKGIYIKLQGGKATKIVK